MNKRLLGEVCVFITIGSTSIFAADGNSGISFKATGGRANFVATTNVFAVDVHGKASGIQITGDLENTSDAVVVRNVEAIVPVKALSTGMSLRDDHMRKKIFKTADGQLPDLKFVVEEARCPRSPGSEFECNVTGNFILRGVAKPLTIALKIRDQKSKLQVAGKAMLKLTSFGIEPPEQLRVRVQDDVQFDIEFTAEQRQELAHAGGRE
jgi:polyisoprenoid-binding protein YceI